MTSFATMTTRQRSEHMAKIRGRDTVPERRVQDFLRAAKVKFTTYAEDLPGTPDLVVAAARVVVFVHGCFWHRHGCKRHRPKTNRDYWDKKFAANVARDRKAARDLRADGWRVFVVWECQTRAKHGWRERLLRALAPDCRICHDCSDVALVGYAHCRRCRARYAKGSRTAPRRKKIPRRAGPSERLRLRRLDLCTSCAMPADGTTCPWHRAQEAKTREKAYARPGFVYTYERKAAVGKCRCNAPVKLGHKRCARCLRKLRFDAKKRIARYFAEGRCRYCKSPRLPETFVCEAHRSKLRAVTPIYVKAWQERHVAAGLCTNCPRKVRPPYKRCSRCRKKRRLVNHDRRVHRA